MGVSVAAVAQQHGSQKTVRRADQAARSETDQKKTPVLCPVSGKPIDRSVFTRFRGKRVYFADKSSIDKFRADPGKYAEALKTQWKALTPLRVQAKCPVTGRAIDKRFFVETPELDMYFTSAEVKASWEANRGKFAGKLDSCFTFQTHCGTCSGDYNPRVSADYKGRHIYFCCPGCRGMFEKSPAKFVARYDREAEANEAKWKRLHQPVEKKPRGPEIPSRP